MTGAVREEATSFSMARRVKASTRSACIKVCVRLSPSSSSIVGSAKQRFMTFPPLVGSKLLHGVFGDHLRTGLGLRNARDDDAVGRGQTGGDHAQTIAQVTELDLL